MEKYFGVLNIPVTSDEITTRNAFLKLAKKYHPDSREPNADSSKFQEIETAYRKVLEKFSRDRHSKEAEGEFGLYYEEKRRAKSETEDKEDVNQFDIKHTAPQHRQYLTYDNVGSGTPSQRERHHRHHRARQAAESTLNYQIERLEKEHQEPALVVQDRKQTRKIKTRSLIDRVVEDLIQESMAKGDFDNLPNAGKPLKFQSHNPFVDSVTHKLNQVLIDNGYAPEWVMLEKDIRHEKERIKNVLKKTRMKLGPLPLSKEEYHVWEKEILTLEESLKSLNKTIDNYNLVVPVMNKQMFHYPIERIAQKILDEGTTRTADVVDSPGEPLASRERFGVKSLISFFKNR